MYVTKCYTTKFAFFIRAIYPRLNSGNNQGSVSIKRPSFPGMEIPMLRIKRESPYLGNMVFILRRGPDYFRCLPTSKSYIKDYLKYTCRNLSCKCYFFNRGYIDRLIFNMGIPTLVRGHLYIKTRPSLHMMSHQMETFSASLALCAGNSPPVNSPHKGQWHGALMFSIICTWIDDWVNNRKAGDLRRNRVHYDVIVMFILLFFATLSGDIHQVVFAWRHSTIKDYFKNNTKLKRV